AQRSKPRAQRRYPGVGERGRHHGQRTRAHPRQRRGAISSRRRTILTQTGTRPPEPATPQLAHGPATCSIMPRFPQHSTDKKPHADLPKWAWPALTDIHHQGFAPGRMSDHGEHGEEEGPAPPLVHPAV